MSGDSQLLFNDDLKGRRILRADKDSAVYKKHRRSPNSKALSLGHALADCQRLSTARHALCKATNVFDASDPREIVHLGGVVDLRGQNRERQIVELPKAADRRQLLLPVGDNYSGRS